MRMGNEEHERHRGMRTVLALVAGLLAVAGVIVVTVISGSPGAAAPRPAKESITLTFAGQVFGEGGLAEPAAYPPIEGGAAREYTVPDGYRLVVESLYATASESWVPNATYPRAFVTAGLDTSYFLGETCAYPGYQRSYNVPLVTKEGMVFGTDEGQVQRGGSLAGPIYVEGGRRVNGAAWAPAGDSDLFVHIVAHGYLEPAANPPAPTCG